MSYNILCYAINHEPLHLDDIILYFPCFDNVLKTFQSYFTRYPFSCVPLPSVAMRAATTIPEVQLHQCYLLLFDTVPPYLEVHPSNLFYINPSSLPGHFFCNGHFVLSLLIPHLTDILIHLSLAMVPIRVYYIRIYSFLSF